MIDWSKIPPEFKWAARDADGRWFAFRTEPKMALTRRVWGVFADPNHPRTPQYIKLTCELDIPWLESLVSRDSLTLENVFKL